MRDRELYSDAEVEMACDAITVRLKRKGGKTRKLVLTPHCVAKVVNLLIAGDALKTWVRPTYGFTATLPPKKGGNRG